MSWQTVSVNVKSSISHQLLNYEVGVFFTIASKAKVVIEVYSK